MATIQTEEKYEFRLVNLFRIVRSLIWVIMPLAFVIEVVVLLSANVFGWLTKEQIGVFSRYLGWTSGIIFLGLVAIFSKVKSLIIDKDGNIVVANRFGRNKELASGEIVEFKIYKFSIPGDARGPFSHREDFISIEELSDEKLLNASSKTELREKAGELINEENWVNNIFISKIKTTAGQIFFLSDVNSIIKLEVAMDQGKIRIPNYVLAQVKNKRRQSAIYWIVLAISVLLIFGALYGFLIFGGK